jgi:hypothetical protein
VWPNVDGHNWRSPGALAGHLLSLAGTNGEFCRLYRAHQLIFLLCAEIHATGTWALIDPARQVAIRRRRSRGRQRPASGQGAAAGPLRRRPDRASDRPPDPRRIDIMLCPVDRNGVIEHVRTDHRRLGYGRLRVAAAPDYCWTTTTINTTLAAKAFWATVGYPAVRGRGRRVVRGVAWRAYDLPQVRAGRPNYAAAKLMSEVGLRINEARWLDLDDITWDLGRFGKLHVREGKGARGSGPRERWCR